MKIVWQIDADDIAEVQAFVERHRASPFVQARIRMNLSASKPPVSKVVFWQQMVTCLLTTQQKSGPSSSVSRFLSSSFPLTYEDCLKHPDVAEFARTSISGFRGLRRFNIIAGEIAANLAFLESGGWKPTLEQIDVVRLHVDKEGEHRAADFIDEHLKGFGPKQARNLLQGLGLSRYEIPIDSRITKWLNAFGFPVRLTAASLQDRHYYRFVSEGIQRLSEACDIMPCILDAAIFASYDKDGWTENNVGGRN